MASAPESRRGGCQYYRSNYRGDVGAFGRLSIHRGGPAGIITRMLLMRSVTVRLIEICVSVLIAPYAVADVSQVLLFQRGRIPSVVGDPSPVFAGRFEAPSGRRGALVRRLLHVVAPAQGRHEVRRRREGPWPLPRRWGRHLELLPRLPATDTPQDRQEKGRASLFFPRPPSTLMKFTGKTTGAGDESCNFN